MADTPAEFVLRRRCSGMCLVHCHDATTDDAALSEADRAAIRKQLRIAGMSPHVEPAWTSAQAGYELGATAERKLLAGLARRVLDGDTAAFAELGNLLGEAT